MRLCQPPNTISCQPPDHPFWSETYSGEVFDFTAPSAAEVNLVDILVGLPNLCRFAGGVSRFYSVAEHSVHMFDDAVDNGATEKEAQIVLMHDAPEVFTVDVIKPIKNILQAQSEMNKFFLSGLEKWGSIIAEEISCEWVKHFHQCTPIDFDSVEGAVEKAVFEKFGMDPSDTPDWLPWLDFRMLITERDQLKPHSGNHFWPGEEKASEHVVEKLPCWSPHEARLQFATRLRECGLVSKREVTDALTRISLDREGTPQCPF